MNILITNDVICNVRIAPTRQRQPQQQPQQQQQPQAPPQPQPQQQQSASAPPSGSSRAAWDAPPAPLPPLLDALNKLEWETAWKEVPWR